MPSVPSVLTKLLSKILLAGVLSFGLSVGVTGCSVFKKSSSKTVNAGGTRVKTKKSAPRMGVNEFLWRASLETLNFMPLSEIDPFGGVIITDWYANPELPNERFKANVYILDTRLRADALKVSIFKQTRNGAGWVDAKTDADTARTIENSILTRARELYIATKDSK